MPAAGAGFDLHFVLARREFGEKEAAVGIAGAADSGDREGGITNGLAAAGLQAAFQAADSRFPVLVHSNPRRHHSDVQK